jgi:phage terminase small subunit
MPKLTPKQEAFCQEYLVDLNATQAAIRAGYSEKTARQIADENLSKPYLAARVQELMAARAERTQLSADWVLDRLKEVAERSMQREPVRDRSGKETGEYRFDSSGANRALELLGKHLGIFKEQVDLEVSRKGLEAARKDLEGMTPMELADLYARSIKGELN